MLETKPAKNIELDSASKKSRLKVCKGLQDLDDLVRPIWKNVVKSNFVDHPWPSPNYLPRNGVFFCETHPPTGSYCPIFKCGMLGKRSATGSSIMFYFPHLYLSLLIISILFGVSGAKELYIFIFPMTKDQGATNWVYQSHDGI
jgi:hypothetical protein